ncbi:unnamed protein product [Ambrosiozyma monospora]|uniref:Unnamed protein product n=1 Tax=Ambrosiozyma monospora TaxID=43982 RepID=A0A9W7DI32_AMBMO|nr:unnamed protein product [Ambrosiozyma monospora]
MSGLDRFSRKTNNFLSASPRPQHRESSPLSRSVSATNMSRMSSYKYNNNGSQFDLYGRSHSPFLDPSSAYMHKKDDQESERLTHYNLNITSDDEEAEKLLMDEKSSYFATKTREDLDSKRLLPYKTETIREQYKYLAHIVTHLYIAIKSLDLKGNISISVSDLEKAKDELSGLSNLPPSVQLLHIQQQQQLNAPTSNHDAADEETYETLVGSDSDMDDDDDDDDDDDEFDEGYESDDEQPVMS